MLISISVYRLNFDDSCEVERSLAVEEHAHVEGCAPWAGVYRLQAIYAGGHIMLSARVQQRFIRRE